MALTFRFARLKSPTSDCDLDELPSFQSERVKLFHGSLMYRDSRFQDFEAAAIVEVIEHLDAPRLSAFERVVFRHARPQTVVITTPNSEYNIMWPTLPAGKMRHPDHRFEWNRDEFKIWCETICSRFKYTVEIFPSRPRGTKPWRTNSNGRLQNHPHVNHPRVNHPHVERNSFRSLHRRKAKRNGISSVLHPNPNEHQTSTTLSRRPCWP